MGRRIAGCLHVGRSESPSVGRCEPKRAHFCVAALFVGFTLAPAGSLTSAEAAEPEGAYQDELDEREAARDGGDPSAAPGHEGRWMTASPSFANASRACSFRAPICVRSLSGVSVSFTKRVLASAEHAYLTYVTALRWPAIEAGATLELVAHVGEEIAFDAPRALASIFDRGSVVTWLDALRGERCAAETQSARAVALHLLARSNPALDLFGRHARATSLAALAEPCVDETERFARATFVREHERGVVSVHEATHRPGVSAAGVDVFYTWIDAERGTQPGATLLAFAALTQTTTAPEAARWHNEPDTFDALRRSFRTAVYKEDGEGELFTAFAQWRALEATSPALIRDEAALDAHQRWPTSAIAIRPKRPLDPTAASYVLFDASDVPKQAQLRLEATWETHAKMMWSITRLDEKGHALSTRRIAQATRATSANATTEPINGAHQLLITAVHTGHPIYQLDPDDDEAEPHAWQLYVAPIE